MIIKLGDKDKQEMKNYRDVRHPYVTWAVKYVDDERFHDEIMSKFGTVFAE